MVTVELPLIPGDFVWIIDGVSGPVGNWKPRQVKINEISWKLNKSGKDLGVSFIANGTRYKFKSINIKWFLNKEECENYIIKNKKEKEPIKWEIFDNDGNLQRTFELDR